jgi:hypothetical protein
MFIPFCGCIALVGTVGGYALGVFATGGPIRHAVGGVNPDMTPPDRGPETVVPDVIDRVRDSPARYVCKGCGPTLAERRYDVKYTPIDTGRDGDTGADAGHAIVDVAPLPPYHPVSFQEEAGLPEEE